MTDATGAALAAALNAPSARGAPLGVVAVAVGNGSATGAFRASGSCAEVCHTCANMCQICLGALWFHANAIDTSWKKCSSVKFTSKPLLAFRTRGDTWLRLRNGTQRVSRDVGCTTCPCASTFHSPQLQTGARTLCGIGRMEASRMP